MVDIENGSFTAEEIAKISQPPDTFITENARSY